jgi:NAD(P)-dependent dehydrogenase (short-subunit alcohol dehydrogenase family)
MPVLRYLAFSWRRVPIGVVSESGRSGASRPKDLSVGLLDGKVALVTGGGRGIGRQVALALAREGAILAVAARTSIEIEAVARECGEGAIALALDVTDDLRCCEVVERCRDQFGRIDILVNSAGIATSAKFTDLSVEEWRSTLAVDLDGPFFMTRHVVPIMLAQGSGAVISLASVAARAGMAFIAAYTAAKHGLLGLTRSLAAEYATSGLTFNCVCPHYVDTPMTQSTVARIMERTGRSKEEVTRRLLTPQRRLIATDEVAAVCVLLASNSGRSINGQAVMVDGGYTMP